MKRGFLVAGVAALFAVVMGGVLAPMVSYSADHGDSPLVAGDAGADVTDVYAFRSPENRDNLVVAVNVNPLSQPGEMRAFSPDTTYNIHVDNTGDVVADATVRVNFSAANSEGTQTFVIGGLGATPLTGPTTVLGQDPKITSAGPIRAYAGPRDDPFFFDLVGFQRFLAGPFVPASGLRPAGEDPSDTLAGSNISAIVLELPIVALTGAANSDTGVIKAWVTTTKRDAGGNVSQFDRMGIPAINTVLIPSDQKDAFNLADPANDVADYKDTVQATIEALRGAVGSVPGFPGEDAPGVPADVLAGVLIPDVVTIDFSNPVAFPNGRTLEDDVVDAAVGLVLNRGNVLGGGPGVGDAIDGNDLPFSLAFPYMAPPHMPPAEPLPVPTPPVTGDMTPSGWFLALMGVGALGLVGSGGWILIARRQRA